MNSGTMKNNDTKNSVLDLALEMQKECGWITEKNISEISRLKGMPESQVFESLSFYSMIRMKEPAKVVIEICRGTSCYTANGVGILNEIEKITNCKIGEASEDGIYHVEYVECIGHCETAPNVLVNGRLYQSVTRETIRSILKEATL